MEIKNKLVDNLIACTSLDAKLVPGLATTNVGPIESKATLAEIAENIAVTTPGLHADTSHARPTMLSGISAFVDKVKAAWLELGKGTTVDGLPEAEKQSFLEWQGMVAAVALCSVYSVTGVKLSVLQESLDGTGNLAMGCVLMEMEKDASYRCAVSKCATGNLQGELYYICQNGQPFALFHPEIGLCPMRQYSSDLFTGVLPWYQKSEEGCHAGWQDISGLGDYCLRRIEWWAMQNKLLLYANYVQKLLDSKGAALPETLQKANSVANAVSVDSIAQWKGKGTDFGTVMAAYVDAGGNPCDMPDIFLEEMMISSVGTAAQNKMVYNNAAGGEMPLQFVDEKGKVVLENFAPVPPLKPAFMDMMKVCKLDSLVFRADLAAGKNSIQRVWVQVTIQTTTGTFNTKKQYDAAKLYLGQVPYLMLWPFLPMPANLWKRYYATWHGQLQDLGSLEDADGKMLPIVKGKLGFAWTQGTTYTVCHHTAPEEPWCVCAADAPLRYAILTETDNDTQAVKELGLVFMPDYPHLKGGTPITAPVQLAVDFGTTSTVCAMRSPLLGASTITLPFQDYSRCVTCQDKDAAGIVNTMHWLGNKESGPGWKWGEKLFSVAQLLDQIPTPPEPNRGNIWDAASQQYYIDGRLFLTSGDVLAAMAGKTDGTDTLKAQQIIHDMKFLSGAVDAVNYHAASIFLSGIYLYALLYLLSRKLVPSAGVAVFDLLVSYPNDATMQALADNWRYAGGILNQVVNSQIVNNGAISPIPAGKFFSEAIATTAYQRRPGSPVEFLSDLVSVDIGGGTTDISISNPKLHGTDVRKLSIRYAGREIMVSSLVELYRRLDCTAPTVVGPKSFSKLWGTAGESLSSQFHALCSSAAITVPFLLGLVQNSSVRMDVEMLLSQGMTLGPAANLNPTNLLRQLIAMKFMMLLSVVADMVAQNLDMWKNPKTGVLNVIGGELAINLSVSGAGAQLLQYVFDCTMLQLQNLDAAAAGPTKQCLDLMNSIFAEALGKKLPAGVKPALHIYVDADVAKKLDVSHGMLEQGIGDLKTAAGEKTSMPADERKVKQEKRQEEITGYADAELWEYLYGKTDAQGKAERRGMMDYWKQYEEIFFPAPLAVNRGLGPDVSVMSGLMTKKNCTAFFAQATNAVASARSAYMIEPEQETYVEQLTGMYMVEELLDRILAQRQTTF